MKRPDTSGVARGPQDTEHVTMHARRREPQEKKSDGHESDGRQRRINGAAPIEEARAPSSARGEERGEKKTRATRRLVPMGEEVDFFFPNFSRIGKRENELFLSFQIGKREFE